MTAVLAATVLIPSLLFPTGYSANAETANSLHSSVKTSLVETSKQKIAEKVQKQFLNDDQVTFLIKLKDQVDTKKVAKAATESAKNQNLTPAQAKLMKRSSIVSNLRAKSLESQYRLKSFLDKKEIEGKAKDIQSFYIVNAVAVTATKEVMEQIALFPEVEKILPNETRQLIQPATVEATEKEAASQKGGDLQVQPKADSSIEWNINKIGAPQVWDMGIDGAGTVIASIDTGVQWDHPALKTKYRGYNPSSPNSPDNEYNWLDATSANQASPYDDLGHGTHTIGTMVGSEENGANKIGVAPGAKYISVKAFTNNGGTDADLLEAGEWVLAPKDSAGNPHPEKAPDVVNNSWGGGAGLDEWFRPMVQTWRDADIFPEFSAGNTTLTNPGGPRSVANPANYPESFATGATDINNKLASFSLQGPSPYEETKPEISAPGVNIRSSVPGGAYEGGWNGTSMAGPHVTAVAALLKQANANLTVDQVETILEDTATPLTDATFPNSPNNGYGHGLVNAFDAVSSVVSGLGTIKGTVTKEGEDSQAPDISHQSEGTFYKGTDITLKATASDDISVTSVLLKYKKQDGTWVDVNAERVDGDYKSGTYSAVIPASETNGDELQYKFVASDFGGNTKETDVFTVSLLPGISVGYEQDFEQKPEGWTSFGDNNSWSWGKPESGPQGAVSGEKVYATNLTGTYPNKANMSLQMPPVDLPEGESYLQFKQWYELEKNYDFGHVFISTDGKNWTQAARFNDKSNGWIDGEVNLSQYAGQRIYIAFNLKTDGSVVKTGWYLDDVKLTATPGQTSQKAKLGASLGTVSDSSAQAKPKVNPDEIKPAAGKAEEGKVDNSNPAPALLPIQAQVSVLETGRTVYTKPQDGSYQLTHAAGDYTVQAEAYGYRSQAKSVHVAQDGTATANFTLEEIAKGTVTGTVTNQQTGQPISGATVIVVEDAAVQPATTNANGEFNLEAYEGNYTLKIVAPTYYSTEMKIDLKGGDSLVKDIQLKPFIGYPGEIKYDDGTAENARAFNAAGNSWAVKMSLEEGQKSALVTGAQFLFWNTEWPVPGGTEFQVSVYDATGTGGSPGKKLAGPFDATALRDGNWTNVDLTSHGITVNGDFYVVYTQTKANPNAPGLATDEDGPNAKRSWQGVSGAWSLSPADEGNYMIRASVNYEVKSPVIQTPKNGAFTNKKEMTIEGSASPKTTVDIFNGGEKAGSAEVSDAGTFAVNITLNKGENVLTAKARTANGSTDASEAVTITLDEEKPALAITSPENGSKTNKETIRVTGTVADDYLDFVKVNGQKATVTAGKFDQRIMVEQGTNEITVLAQDKAGNKTKTTLTISAKYTAPAIANLVPTEDKELKSGESVKIEFDSEPGLKAEFQILMPLTNAGDVTNATELPMKETSSGHYVGYYTATSNVKAPGAAIEVKASDDYGNVSIQRAAAKLYINAKK
ncbi:S8 family peptidase [Bacillus testis]|uniref:S8 family peptidase n=1 Tax=Bacillus testis TaxID=1622072 RepID=UPI0011CBAC68|nr:S8 family peptidase [Bacillus testis]